MSTVITENELPMTSKERVLEIINNFIQTLNEEFDDANSKYGKLRRNEDADYKDVRKADIKCSFVEGQIKAFECVSNIIERELTEDIVPKSVVAVREGHCSGCHCELNCTSRRDIALQGTICPRDKW